MNDHFSEGFDAVRSTERLARETSGAILIAACSAGVVQQALKLLSSIRVENPVKVLPGIEDLILLLKPGEDGVYGAKALILLDLANKREDSFAFLRRAHYHCGELEEVPIIVLVGRSDLSLMNRAYQLGARTFLTKPLNPVEFTMMVESLRLPVVYSSEDRQSRF